uniref:ATP synthase F0 subunit 6 n=1 Tax=Bregmaceros mcclellandi TaxID=2831535 RepID=UPI001EDF296D|nr:ATP synthase F0 subunit 6 [Bregmaceros mcclellandi]UIX24719.1 ATP synthase F0 subunit 6 [Bregmaceros mcclellandi]
MALSLFNQFQSPCILGISLVFIAIIIPCLFLPSSTSRLLNNRLLTLQNWFFARFINQIFLPLNTGGHKWALIITSLASFLILTNILGLLPYTFTPTTQLSLNLGLAIPLWLGTVIIGFRHTPTHALAHLLPEGTPTLLIPILIIIESISLFIRPLALGVRLTANLTAGHLLIHLVGMAIMALMSSPVISVTLIILLLLLTLLEIAVALIQAYVFVLLLSLYLQENT